MEVPPGAADRDRRPPLGRTAVLAAAMIALGAVDFAGGAAALAVAIAGAAAMGILERVAAGRARPAAVIAAVGALGYGALAASPTPAAEILAGIGGLAFLAWLAPRPTRLAPTSRLLEGLVLPGLAVGIAFATGVFLPPAGGLETVGIALLVGVLVAVVLVLGRPGLLTPPQKPLEAARGGPYGAAATARPSTVEGSL